MLKKPASIVLASLEGSGLASKILGAHYSHPSASVKGHCQLTNSLARTDVMLVIPRIVRLIVLRVADLAAALPVGKARLGAPGSGGGENEGLFEHPKI